MRALIWEMLNCCGTVGRVDSVSGSAVAVASKYNARQKMARFERRSRYCSGSPALGEDGWR